ncbi:peptidase domain-containing ABC transporter [Leeia aquatica]|uniref:Cyclolysin secretion/processing ATP-binding protein CyaB n=1 Tax=Leeia aquatica TaxID=2725557 RepID=A0A847S8V2_9NEIS|nr:peptidase domain-containing ABC transporter [Leeia aquatica]NLR76193.1 peptidase domain-containing ABC transporter [Leeia aquatica]
MSILQHLRFSMSPQLPIILQTEAAECGLACLAMVSSWHGHRVDLPTLRNRFNISLKGVTLANLIQMANQLEMNSRPLKLELTELDQLRRPCILHWNLNHFVVLHAVNRRGIVIHDPALGKRQLSWEEASRSFTGVALELWPSKPFQPRTEVQRVRLRELMGQVGGFRQALWQILGLSAALEVFSLITPLMMQWVLDHVLTTGDLDLLTTLGISFLTLTFFNQAINALRKWVMLYLGTTLNLQWRSNLFTHLLNLPVQYFERRHVGDVVSRFGSIDAIQQTLTTSFMEAILDGIMTLLTLTVMYLYSPALATIAVLAMLAYAVGRALWFRPLRNATEAQIVYAARQQSHFLESIRGIKAIKLFQRQDIRRSTWLTLQAEQVNAGVRTQQMSIAYEVYNSLLFGLVHVVMIWVGAKAVLAGEYTAGALMAFIAYKTQFDGRVSSLVNKYFELKMLQLQGARLADIALTPPETLQREHAEPTETITGAADITLQEVRFRYGTHESWVLDGASLKVNAGESVAIVGPSGCGKTTLIHVMLGIHTPESGDVCIGDVSLKKLGPNAIRQLVGTVMQDDVLFAGSIKDNISFFDPHADREWVEECAQRAAIHEDILRMPMGYNTLVGDMGTAVSGGQKQRLLLARALYKRPHILYLDEATSSLDVELEHLVNQSVKALQITRIIVAHRPQTIASADRVVLLQQGKLQELSRTADVAMPEASLS